jgi:hypothetical protein
VVVRATGGEISLRGARGQRAGALGRESIAFATASGSGRWVLVDPAERQVEHQQRHGRLPWRRQEVVLAFDEVELAHQHAPGWLEAMTATFFRARKMRPSSPRGTASS